VNNISNPYFYKKPKSYKVCNGFKNKVCFNIVVGFGNQNTKIHPTFIEIQNHTCAMPIIILLIRCGHISFLLKKSKV
jgi:hypothetical protein